MDNLRIYLAGHKGMVGSALVRVLQKNNETNLVTKSKKELNLVNQEKVQEFFKWLQGG